MTPEQAQALHQQLQTQLKEAQPVPAAPVVEDPIGVQLLVIFGVIVGIFVYAAVQRRWRRFWRPWSSGNSDQ